MRDEKLHAAVARSTFPSQNAQNTSCSDHFSNGFGALLEVEMSQCGAKHTSKSTCTKHLSVGPLLKLRCRKSARRCGAKHIAKSNVKSTTCSRHFWTLKRGFVWQAQWILHLAKSKQNLQVL